MFAVISVFATVIACKFMVRKLCGLPVLLRRDNTSFGSSAFWMNGTKGMGVFKVVDVCIMVVLCLIRNIQKVRIVNIAETKLVASRSLRLRSISRGIFAPLPRGIHGYPVQDGS
jgi:hypothetical protein